MADDKVRVNAQSKCFHGNSLFLSSAIFILVIINSSIFLAFTIHQLRQIGDVERMLLEKRLRLENIRASCWNNNYSKKVCRYFFLNEDELQKFMHDKHGLVIRINQWKNFLTCTVVCNRMITQYQQRQGKILCCSSRWQSLIDTCNSVSSN